MHDPDRLLRHGAMLTAAALIAHPLNLGFHIAAGRLIPTAEYGALAAGLGAFALLGAPLTAVRMTVSHGAATDPATGGLEMARRWARLSALVGLVAAVGAAFLADRISLWLNLGSPVTVWAMAVAFVPIALNPVVSGRIQGLQLFRWLAALGVVAALTRLGAGCMLMLAWPTAASALLATAAAALVALALGAVAIRSANRGDHPESTRGVSPALALVPTTLAVIGLAGLQHLDLVIVKLLAEPDPAGQYAQASLLGRALPFLTLPLANALFPKTAALGLAGGRGRRLFFRAVVLSLGAAAGAVAAFTLAPQTVLGLVFGADRATPALAELAVRIVPAFLPLAVTGPAVYAALADGSRGVPAILVAGMTALAVGALVAGGDARGTTVVVATVQCTVALAVVTAPLLRWRSGPPESDPH